MGRYSLIFYPLMVHSLPIALLLTELFIRSGFKAEIEEDKDAKKRENRLENLF